MRKTIYAMTMAVSMMLASCSKDKETEESETPSAKISQSALMGKWEAVSVVWNYYKLDGSLDYDAGFDIDPSKKDDPDRTFITFNADNSFFHIGNWDGSKSGTMLQDILKPSGGKWSLLNDNKTIKMDTFAPNQEWSVIEFSNKRMKLENNTPTPDGKKSKIIIVFIK